MYMVFCNLHLGQGKPVTFSFSKNVLTLYPLVSTHAGNFNSTGDVSIGTMFKCYWTRKCMSFC